MNEAAMENARRAALDQAEKDERLATRLTYAAGVFEVVAFIAILFVIDWSDSTHVLIFLCACLVYAPLAIGLLALRSHVDRGTQRLLAAVAVRAE